MSKCMLILAGALLAGAAAATDNALAQCAAVDDPAARLACYDALAGRAPQAAIPALPGAPAATAPDDIASFGKPRNAAETLTARIVGMPKEWKRGTRFTLDNGQVWLSVDDKSAYYPNVAENPEIEITRGMFGYSMNIKAIGKRVSVRRIL